MEKKQPEGEPTGKFAEVQRKAKEWRARQQNKPKREEIPAEPPEREATEE